MEDITPLEDEVASLEKEIKALEQKKRAAEKKLYAIKTKQLQEEYPWPAELTWDYIFSVPHYVLSLTKDRHKAFEVFTGRDGWYFPFHFDGIFTKTGKVAMYIYLHTRYGRESIEYAIDSLKPVMKAALEKGQQEYFPLMGRAEHLCLRLFDGKWYLCSERFDTKEGVKPTTSEWEGDSREDGLRIYNMMNETDAS